MSSKGYNALLVTVALAGLSFSTLSFAKDKDSKEYKEYKESKDKDKSSKKDYSTKDYRSSMISPDGSTSGSTPGSASSSSKSSSTVKLSSTDRAVLHVHDVLAPADDEWQVLRPRIEKIVVLQKEAGAGRDPKGPRAPSSKELAKLAEGKSSSSSSSNSTASPVSDSARALNVTLADEAARLQDLRQRVAVARDARARVKSELVRTQEDLRGLLTVRQEAALIVMGLLD